MKKFFLIFLWLGLSALYLFPESGSGILALRANLWAQMTVSAFVLASGGAVLQILLANPLADPWLLGVTGLSSLGSAVAVFFALSPLLFWSTAFSLAGSGVAIAFLLLASRRHSAATLILVGVGINSLCSALIVLLQGFLSPNNFFASLSRISGYFTERSLNERMLLLPALFLAAFLPWRYQKELFILAAGETSAQSVGVDAKKIKKIGIISLSAALALTAGLSGTVGFIGLAAPHIIKRMFGFSHILDIECLLPLSGILILAAALILRLLPAGVFVPLGSVLALLGAPLFIWLLFKESR